HDSLDSLRRGILSTEEAQRKTMAMMISGTGDYAVPGFLMQPIIVGGMDWIAHRPSLAQITSQLCTHDQFFEDIYLHWCAVLRQPPMIHRKQWEFVYILEALRRHGVLVEGARGLGFGTGREPLPSVFAAHAVDVLATDAPSATIEGAGWDATRQHSTTLQDLHQETIVDKERFNRHVSFRAVDMNDLPDDLSGFDFCWSSCAFEHLGSIAHGLDFVANSLRSLRPGGIAVHTTEFNLSSNTSTVEADNLCLFRKRDIEVLVERLNAEGHWVAPVNCCPGSSPVDYYIDLPPYADSQILKIMINNYITTSIGIIIRKKISDDK
ncbi:MAG: class I SAM-dependent methyltransferase, partial [Rhodospirillales bacterium]|nr:class I SAM-dependent methyltransferase [Rhodospirillales bacterium]